MEWQIQVAEMPLHMSAVSSFAVMVKERKSIFILIPLRQSPDKGNGVSADAYRGRRAGMLGFDHYFQKKASF
jgi:hypothetical protein